jgi:methanogenic corrinoid protein MtbC1
MPAIKATIEALNAAELRGQIKVMICGAPVPQEYAILVGADGFSSDARRAVATVKELVSA